MLKRLFIVLLAVSSLAACKARNEAPTTKCKDNPTGEVAMTCELPGWEGRPYDLFAPPGDGPFPLIFGIHGGGGQSQAAIRGACPDGDVKSAACLHAMALDRGYAIVFPNGISSELIERARTWNGGGGGDDWRCVGGRACEENIDDVQYFRDLVDHIDARVAVERDQIFSTGLSNGGAMSHRLGCELAGIRAIAPVGGAMQFTTNETCTPSEPVGVLHIHGTEDPCWKYDGGVSDCPIGKQETKMVSVDRTMSDWAAALNCGGETTEVAMPNPAADGSESFRVTYAGCDAPLELIRMEGTGHTWPNGFGYFPESVIGPVSTDFGNEVILDWFDRF